MEEFFRFGSIDQKRSLLIGLWPKSFSITETRRLGLTLSVSGSAINPAVQIDHLKHTEPR